jgi:uncharacterized membrane protein YgdD (TMEM256/DUF423 family)
MGNLAAEGRFGQVGHGISLLIMGKAANSGRFWLASAALNGFAAVAMGAIVAHALRNRLAPEALEWVRTGSTYQMWHALALLALALMPGTATVASRRIAGWAFLVGCSLFSGSLYLLAFTGWHGFACATPIGGAAFLAGWAALAWCALTPKHS